MAKTKRPPQTRKKLGGPRVAPDGPRQSKVDAVSDFKTRVEGSTATILTEYRGMTVHELAELRASLREAGTDYKVFKNTLATLAAKDLGLDDLIVHLEGPVAVAFATGDPVVTAKRLSDFAKKVPALVLKAGVLEGRVLSSKDVTALSTLESREVMLTKAAGLFIMQIQKAANLFAAGFNQLGSLLVQLKEKLPAEGATPEAATTVEEMPGDQGPTEGSAPVQEAAGEQAVADEAAADAPPTTPSEPPAETPVAQADNASAEPAPEAAPPEERPVEQEAAPPAEPSAEPAAEPTEAAGPQETTEA